MRSEIPLGISNINLEHILQRRYRQTEQDPETRAGVYDLDAERSGSSKPPAMSQGTTTQSRLQVDLEGSVHAIPADAYLEPDKTKRKKIPKTFDNCETKNLFSKYVTHNSRCFRIPPTKNPAGPYSQSFFPEQLSTRTS